MIATYTRTEDGQSSTVSVREALDEINRAQMTGRRDVREMSYSRGHARIVYRDGRRVALDIVTEQTVEAPVEEEPREWRGTRTRPNRLHRFNPETGRARCNSRIAPHRYPRDQDNAPKTRADVLAGKFASLYTFCPGCEGA